MRQRRHPIFRVFVSSTFSDFVEERNVLQREVFPQMHAYCATLGARFQMIDLRWGVGQEAALDQQAMTICLQELVRCQTMSPKPNFLILIGDRYGWRPLPERVPAAEFEELISFLSPEERALLNAESPVGDGGHGDSAAPRGWYRKDNNAVPAVCLLQPRRAAFAEDVPDEEKDRLANEEASEWARVEAQIRRTLAKAIAAAGRHLVTQTRDGHIHVWELATRAVVTRHAPVGDCPYRFQFSLDGRWLATWQGEIAWIWEVELPKDPQTLRGEGLPVDYVTFSPDGLRLAIGFENGTVRAGAIAPGVLKDVVPASEERTSSLAFSPDGKSLFVALDSRVVCCTPGVDREVECVFEGKGEAEPWAMGAERCPFAAFTVGQETVLVSTTFRKLAAYLPESFEWFPPTRPKQWFSGLVRGMLQSYDVHGIIPVDAQEEPIPEWQQQMEHKAARDPFFHELEQLAMGGYCEDILCRALELGDQRVARMFTFNNNYGSEPLETPLTPAAIATLEAYVESWRRLAGRRVEDVTRTQLKRWLPLPKPWWKKLFGI